MNIIFLLFFLLLFSLKNIFVFKKYILILIFFSTTALSFAQTSISISDDLTSQIITKEEIFYLEDKTVSLYLEDIISTDYENKFKIIPKNNANFGYTSSAYWLRLKLENKLKNENPLHFLEIEYPNLDSIQLFYKNKTGIWENTLIGDKIPFSTREYKHRDFIFALHLKEIDTEEYIYLRIHTKGSVLVPLEIHSHDSLRITQVHRETFFGFFYGILFIMGFYNLLIYFTLREKAYLLYVVSIFLNIISQASLSGHAIQYLWGDSIYWSNVSIIFFIELGFAVLLMFSITFLQLRKKHKKLYFFMVVLIFLNVLFCLLGFFIDYNISVRLMVIFVLISCCTMIFAGAFTWAKGNKASRFFTLAWIVYLIGTITMALRNAGILPDMFLSRHGVHLGSILEVSLLSFALADQINIYRKNIKDSQQLVLLKSKENEELIKGQNEVLERRVKERTTQLHQVNKALVTQEEELRQNMEELQVTQETLQIQSQELEYQNLRMQNSIKAALEIQTAILPHKEKLDTLFKEYFVIYEPKSVVSGDFYWANKIENKVIFASVDCTGHGVQGAFMSLIGNTLLDKIINVLKITNPAQILSRLDNDIQALLRQKETGNDNGMDISIITLEENEDQTTKLEFAAAKQTFIYIEADKLKEIKGDKKLIGGRRHDNQIFTTHTLELQKGTILYVGSDGITDQNDNLKNKFGRKRLYNLLQENSNLPLLQQKKNIENTLQTYMQNTTQRDDILWIGIKI